MSIRQGLATQQKRATHAKIARKHLGGIAKLFKYLR